jgi:hypothetical protein
MPLLNEFHNCVPNYLGACVAIIILTLSLLPIAKTSTKSCTLKPLSIRKTTVGSSIPAVAAVNVWAQFLQK